MPITKPLLWVPQKLHREIQRARERVATAHLHARSGMNEKLMPSVGKLLRKHLRPNSVLTRTFELDDLKYR